MPDVVILETAINDLKGLLTDLSLGETVTIADEQGTPVALLVSLQSRPVDGTLGLLSNSDWIERWDALAREIDKAWQGEKSALDELAEMRR